VAGETFDLAVSNPPYIAGDDPHLPALRHEPRQALTPKGTGWMRCAPWCAMPAPICARGLAAVRTRLGPGRGRAQAADAAGFGDVQTRQDLAGVDRCTGGRMPGGMPGQPETRRFPDRISMRKRMLLA
jgi:release factor glutamine methyltransferase